MQVSDTDRKQGHRLLSETLLIFITPAIGYVFVYQYELGFCKFFGIPPALIEVSLYNLVRAVGTLYLVGAYVYFLIEVVRHINIFKKIIWRRVGFNILLVLVTFFFLYANDLFKWPEVLFIIILPLYILYLEFIDPLIRGKHIKGYAKKIAYQEEQEVKGDMLLDKAIKKIGVPNFTLLFLIFLLFGIMASLGSLNAKRQRSFLVINSEPRLVVLRKYSDNLICAEFYLDKKQTSNKLIIKKLGWIAEVGVSFVAEEVGPLEPIKKGKKQKVVEPSQKADSPPTLP